MVARIVYGIITLISLTACSESPPHGRWEATAKVEILKERGYLTNVAFFIEKGEVCALSDKWYIQKEMRYKDVLCPKGKGWITDDEHFKNSALINFFSTRYSCFRWDSLRFAYFLCLRQN